jgi:hypothetical protein
LPNASSVVIARCAQFLARNAAMSSSHLARAAGGRWLYNSCGRGWHHNDRRLRWRRHHYDRRFGRRNWRADRRSRRRRFARAAHGAIGTPQLLLTRSVPAAGELEQRLVCTFFVRSAFRGRFFLGHELDAGAVLVALLSRRAILQGGAAAIAAFSAVAQQVATCSPFFLLVCPAFTELPLLTFITQGARQEWTKLFWQTENLLNSCDRVRNDLQRALIQQAVQGGNALVSRRRSCSIETRISRRNSCHVEGTGRSPPGLRVRAAIANVIHTADRRITQYPPVASSASRGGGA